MEPLAARNEAIRRVHRRYLKERGFALRASRSEQSWPPLLVAATLHSQPWNSSTNAEFDIQLCVAHTEYNPYAAYGLKPGVGLKDVHLASFGLAKLQEPSLPFWSITSEEQVEPVLSRIDAAFQDVGIAALSAMSSLEGILSLLREKSGLQGFKPQSWILKAMGQSAEATDLVNTVIERAASESRRQDAIKWRVWLDA